MIPVSDISSDHLCIDLFDQVALCHEIESQVLFNLLDVVIQSMSKEYHRTDGSIINVPERPFEGVFETIDNLAVI
jgi:hypothetical protein